MSNNTETEYADSGWYSEEAATFGDRVSGARETMAMSQSELAKRLGVNLKTVRAWEEDLSEPRANKLQMLSGVLNVSIKWLLIGQGDGLDGPAASLKLPSDINNFLNEIRDLKTNLTQTADRLALLEKRLRASLKDQL